MKLSIGERDEVMKYARINLEVGNYKQLTNWEFIYNPNISQLNMIYQSYCEYKNFESVVPIFDKEYLDADTDIFGYYHQHDLVAFSLIKRYDSDNAESLQFAWDYKHPKLRLGIRSLNHECAIYKSYGFKYLYIGEADEYKQEIDGFEIIGKLKQ